MNEIVINGQNLSIQDTILVARGYHDGYRHHFPLVVLDEEIKEKLKIFREALEERIAAKDIMYGVNTGCGIKKGTVISADEINNYQKHYIPAHCVAIGEFFPEEVVRAAMIFRVNSFALGHSGVRLELCEKILEFYNKGIIPCVPSQGSVGSSGDLCFLAHISAALIGLKEQQVFFEGEIMSCEVALEKARVQPISLKAKEAMALTNGSTFILAQGILAIYDIENLIDTANIAAALSLEAIRGEIDAFDERVHAIRKSEGANNCAQVIRDLCCESKRMSKASQDKTLPAEKHIKKFDVQGKPVPRVQDAYSFRAHAQVMGSVMEAFDFCKEIFKRELNAATDNPLIFEEGDGFRAISGGNFHGEPLAQAADFLKIAVQQLANISDRRFYALTMPSTSYGLPADLVGLSNPDLNTGLMILQYSTAALVNENKSLCHPSVIDSIPTSANQEDYVSMGATSAKFLRKVVENTTYVVAAELLAAAQGISWTEEDLGPDLSPLGTKTKRAYNFIRQYVKVMDDDRFIQADWLKIIEQIKNQEFVRYVYDDNPGCRYLHIH
ncbi:MAG: aromatic amino acid lyase [Candidatus Pacebacteria bacterium]|nr:aromatic amino acid lyase [Candidatus Paceibacterota bacterium]